MTGYPASVSEWLQGKRSAGALVDDRVQTLAAQALDGVLDRLKGYDSEPGLLGLFSRDSAPKGLYLWGGVGRGKSMLMDVFFRLAPIKPKRRVHFYAFMIDIHGRINDWRKLDRSGRRASPHHKRGTEMIRLCRSRGPSLRRRLCCVSMNFTSPTSPTP